jgi:hypothetical protein
MKRHRMRMKCLFLAAVLKQRIAKVDQDIASQSAEIQVKEEQLRASQLICDVECS